MLIVYPGTIRRVVIRFMLLQILLLTSYQMTLSSALVPILMYLSSKRSKGQNLQCLPPIGTQRCRK